MPLRAPPHALTGVPRPDGFPRMIPSMNEPGGQDRPPEPLHLRSAKISRRVRKALAQSITRQEIRAARPDPVQVPIAARAAQDVQQPPIKRAGVLVSLPRRRQSKFEAAPEAVPPPMRASNVPRVGKG